MNHHELRRAFSSTLWAMQPEHLQSLQASLELLTSGGPAAEHALKALADAKQTEAARRQSLSAQTGGAVAVLPLYGVISQRSNWMSYYFGGTTCDSFTMQFREAVANPGITAVVLDIDSPGGSVAGVDELASEVYAARGKKRIVAVSDTLCASAAYYIASQAHEIVALPSSLTGSIGVYQTHESVAGYLKNLGVEITLVSAGKFKVEGNSYEPLTDEARAAMQTMVDGYYTLFVKAVARGRGVKMSDVTSGLGQGRVLMAADAVTAGMVDRVGTLDSVLGTFGVKRPIDTNAEAISPIINAVSPVEAPPSATKPDDDTDTDDPCECPCDPCMKADCGSCVVEDCASVGCDCTTAKNNRDEANQDTARSESENKQAHLIALQAQRIRLQLSLLNLGCGA